MNQDESELSDYVSRNLFDLASSRDYPIYDSIGLWCFFQGFGDYFEKSNAKRKLFVDYTNDRREAILTFYKNRLDESDVFYESFDYNSILRGIADSPRASLTSLHHSVYEVFGKFKGKLDETDIVGVKKEISRTVLEYFKDYQENLLLPIHNEDYILFEQPLIFDRVYRNLERKGFSTVYKGATFNNSLNRPDLAYLIENKWDYSDFDASSYHPDKSDISEYFWLNYFFELIKEKRYPLDSSFKTEELEFFGDDKKRGFLHYLASKKVRAIKHAKFVPEFKSR